MINLVDVSQSPNFHERHAAGALTYSISKAFSSSLAKLASRNRHNHGWVLQSSTTTIQYQQTTHNGAFIAVLPTIDKRLPKIDFMTKYFTFFIFYEIQNCM